MVYDFDTVYDRRSTDSSKWGRVEPDVLPMPVADMDFKSPEPIRRALAARVEQGFYGYGLAQEELHNAFTARLQRRFGWTVPQDAVLPIPGVIPGFNAALRALTKPGESVVVQLPSYPPILNAHTHHGIERRDAFLVRGDSGRYEIDFDSFRAAMDARTRLLLLCHPHNPVGRAWRRGELEDLAAFAAQRDLVVCSDEIHSELLLEPGRPHVPFATLSPDAAARTITLLAPSKTYNLPGLGCAVAVLWSSFPEDTQRRLVGQAAAVADREEVLRPRLAIEAFLRDHAS